MAVLHHMHKAQLVCISISVKFDVVYFVVVCWALLLQSFGVEQIVHTMWPTEIFVCACVEVEPISFGQQSINSCYLVRLCKVFCFHVAYHGARVFLKVGI